MGGSWSSLERESTRDPWWPTEQLGPATLTVVMTEEGASGESATSKKGRVRQEELEAFKEDLARKRALRHEAIAAVQAELKELRGKAEDERKLREQAEEERDKLRTLLENKTREGTSGKPMEEEFHKIINVELNSEPEHKVTKKEDELRMELEKEREEKSQLLEERDWLRGEADEKLSLQRQVQALRDVSEIGKEMLKIREMQVKELKKKLVEVNMSSVMGPPEDLRIEYEKQIENIRRLRTLYEEREAATTIEHRRELEREEARIIVLETKLRELQKETDEVKEIKKELEDKIEKLENSIQSKENELETTKDDLFSRTVQNKSLNSQIVLINNLFSHMLVNPKVDLDRLTRLLQENHGLIKDLTVTGDSNEVAALLVDLAGQVEKEQSSDEEQKENSEENVIESDISSNLTKVWKVLIELLSYHDNALQTEPASGAESCYKCVQTPSGPRSVISVSQTFLTLKDLILEKNKLMKEVGRLKTLNNHLENRLGNQEKRLSVVTLELRKTWGVVNKLKAQHKQLHTHEKILRYELHQKRCMLTELKQELELCRDKWDLAREKNSQTEEDWKKLRKEFASRKTRKESNSAESGYEEDDVAHSPPSEPINQEELFNLRPIATSEAELSEDDIEHSDGNSFDTVIDLLDIAYLENQPESQSAVPFVLCEVPPEIPEIPPSLLPLTSSEFTDGLDQIESEDLAAVLDIQYQNQLLGADYNLSLPSSSGSSPVPTENDDFASSEIDVSEEDSSSNSNNLFSSPTVPTSNQTSSNDNLLFGSNSSQNISKFMDGLFFDNQQTEENVTSTTQNLTLSVNCISLSGSVTPAASEQNYCQFSSGTSTPKVVNGNSFEFPSSQEELIPGKAITNETEGMENVQTCVFDPQATSPNSSNQEQCSGEKSIVMPTETRSQEEILRARENRLKKLEYQCRSLVNKVTSTNFRSGIISNKLDELHLSYGPSDESDMTEQSSEYKSTNERQESEHIGFQETLNSSITPDVLTSDLNPSNGCQKTLPSEEQEPCSSGNSSPSQSSSPVQTRTPEQVLEARAARLKRLEDQCKSLFCKMSATSSRSELISNKLDELHESYGVPEQAVTDKIVSKESLLSKSSYLESQNHEKEADCSTSCTNQEKSDVTSNPKDLHCDDSDAGPSSIQSPTIFPRKGRTPEQILEARAERFKRLEDQCKSLVTQMTATSLRSELISNKLDKLHSSYGSSEDASDSEENPFSSREGKKRSTPTSSPRYSRKLAQLTERKNETDTAESSNIDKLKGRLPQDSLNLLKEMNLPCDQINVENTNAPVNSQSNTINSLECCSKNETANSVASNFTADRLDKQTTVQLCQPLVTEPFALAVNKSSDKDENTSSETVNSTTSHTETILLNSECKDFREENKNNSKST